MTSSENEATILRVYEAYAALDIATIDALMAPGFVMHITGNHPLSGDRTSRDDVWTYLGKVAEISSGNGGYDVHAVTTDDRGHAVALLTGTIRDFVRPVIHVWHLEAGQVTEFWDAYPDAAGEDRFWTTAVQT